MNANIKNTFQATTGSSGRSPSVSGPIPTCDINSAGFDTVIDHESYVDKLTRALAGPHTPTDNSEPIAGMRMLAYMQKEGVFGISPHGRYHSVIDFIKTKSFEYELEQRQFNIDEFLRETEAAIYDIITRGNSSQITKSLLAAAESVNQFRNDLARSSDEAGSGS